MPGARSASISVVKTSAPSRSSTSCRRSGRSAWAPSQSTAHSAAGSSFHVAVAKCSATRGENVQSSSRVGRPRGGGGAGSRAGGGRGGGGGGKPPRRGARGGGRGGGGGGSQSHVVGPGRSR